MKREIHITLEYELSTGNVNINEIVYRLNDPDGKYCRGRKVRKKGYRNKPRNISTVFGDLTLRIREVECCKYGARHTSLLTALKIGQYSRREKNLSMK